MAVTGGLVYSGCVSDMTRFCSMARMFGAVGAHLPLGLSFTFPAARVTACAARVTACAAALAAGAPTPAAAAATLFTRAAGVAASAAVVTASAAARMSVSLGCRCRGNERDAWFAVRGDRQTRHRERYEQQGKRQCISHRLLVHVVHSANVEHLLPSCAGPLAESGRYYNDSLSRWHSARAAASGRKHATRRWGRIAWLDL